MMLERIFEKQEALQVKFIGQTPESLNNEQRADYIRDMTLACTDELHEALQEVGWKPWATSRHLDPDKFGAELVDALHFLVNLFLVVGWDANDVYEAYLEKSDRNLKRQLDGYDGVDGKCPTCHRAEDDK